MITEQEKKVLDLISEDEVIQLITDLVRAKSPNPPGDTREAANVCLKKFEEYGIDAQLVTAPDKYVSTLYPDTDNNTMPSVLATMKGAEDGPTLLLNAHIDTVRPGDLNEWHYDPFDATIVDGMVYGRGVGDDKGAVMAQILAACAIKKSGFPFKGTLQINPIADEEANANRGTKFIVNEGLVKPDMVIIGEQTDNRIALGERFPAQAHVTIKGKACHGAMPWNGVNATVICAKFINLIVNELQPEVESYTMPYFPKSTISPTRIDGGIQVNIIPEQCKLMVDIRCCPNLQLDYVLQRMDELLQRLYDEGPKFEWDIKIADRTPGTNGIYTDPDSPLIKCLLSAQEDVQGKPDEPTAYRQGSDGERFVRFNIPIALLGPSDPSVGHSPDEHCTVKQLVECTKIYALAIMRLMG